MIQPVCAYRFQFTPDDTFAVATSVVPYLSSLGVSHLYLSPIAEAEEGSRHGYDIVDPGRIRAELGGEEGFAELIRTLEQHDMGWILDIVPNHLSNATPEANPWFWDVLRLGRQSEHATTFDIDWGAADGKILMPVLDRSLDQVVEDGAIMIIAHTNGADTVLQLPSGLRLPVRPESEPSGASLQQLLGEQHYRLLPWQSTRRNVRRFFEIDSLVAVAIENPEVCEARHELLRRLVAEYPSLSGVRVDHVDGLADPDTYLRWLRNLIGPDRLLLVEKIVLGSEQLPARWPVDGTTGYEFARLVDRLLLDEAGFKRVVGDYAELTTDRRDFEDIEANAIDEVLRDRLSPDVVRIARIIATNPRLEGDRGVQAIVRLAGSFRRYRTYLPEGAESDLAVLTDARDRAVSGLQPHEVESVDALVSVLGAPTTETERKALSLFQQLTGPALAKGIEDRAIYRHLPLAALSEVGASPLGPSADAAEFHDWAQWAAVHAPRGMLTTTTHDTKRAGDVRARLLTLSDHADEWRRFCDDWIDFDADRLDVNRIDRYVILQHAVGTWPISTERLGRYVRKALREGAERTSWINVNHEYESAVEALIGSLLGDPDFRPSVEVLLGQLGPGPLVRSMSQVLLRLTAPGFGDLYRGDEVQKLSLVDPDNRRRLDWTALAEFLEEARSLDVAAAINVSPDMAKMSLIVRVLRVRSASSTDMTYEVLPLVGLPSDSDALAFRYGNLVVFLAHRLAQNHWRHVQVGLPPGVWTDELVDGRQPLTGTVTVDQIVDVNLPLRLFTRA